MKNLIIFITLSLLTFSCATMSKEQCTLGDWKGTGLTDGENGYPRTRLADHQKACSEHGVKINKNEYDSCLFFRFK